MYYTIIICNHCNISVSLSLSLHIYIYIYSRGQAVPKFDEGAKGMAFMLLFVLYYVIV